MPTINLPATNGQWLDTGLTVFAGGGLDAVCVGTYDWNNGGGTSVVNGSGWVVPTGPGGATADTGFPAAWAEVAPYGVALLLLPVGQAPAAGQYAADVFGFTPRTSAVTTTVSRMLTAGDIAAGTTQPGPHRVWARISDDDPTNNSGGPLVLTVTATGTPPPCSPPPAPVLRATGRLTGNAPEILIEGNDGPDGPG